MPEISEPGAEAGAADPHDLQRFVSAQAGVHDQALDELRAGRKRTHWMWFVFPQLRGLGSSAMAHRYGVASIEEARAYLAHPLLGPRLEAAARAVVECPGQTVGEIFGSPDDVKFRSCMTLFEAAAGKRGSVFEEALERRCGGVRDARTVGMLGLRGGPAGEG